jgi:hypothetical protein
LQKVTLAQNHPYLNRSRFRSSEKSGMSSPKSLSRTSAGSNMHMYVSFKGRKNMSLGQVKQRKTPGDLREVEDIGFMFAEVENSYTIA